MFHFRACKLRSEAGTLSRIPADQRKNRKGDGVARPPLNPSCVLERGPGEPDPTAESHPRPEHPSIQPVFVFVCFLISSICFTEGSKCIQPSSGSRKCQNPMKVNTNRVVSLGSVATALDKIAPKTCLKPKKEREIPGARK